MAVARARLREAEPLSQSPGETRLRLVLVDGGLPRPQAQVPIRTAAGDFVADGDLGWLDAETAYEYLGAVHLEAVPAAKDRARRRAIGRETTWEVLEAGSPEMAQPHVIVGTAWQSLEERCPRLVTGRRRQLVLASTYRIRPS